MPPPIFVARDRAAGILVAVSERGAALAGVPSPTAFLARDFARELGFPDLPLVRATQVHGASVVTVEERPAPGETRDAGECDALVTRLAGVGLVVQTADCVPVLLAARDAVGAVHSGWRGAARNVAGMAAEVLLDLAVEPESVRAWMGPSIGSCCYEVGAEVAERFPSEFVRPNERGKYQLDLSSAVRRQLESAGVPSEAIMQPKDCTMCGGERLASWRRDRERAGRMIGLVARL
jgi:YfiH family protein